MVRYAERIDVEGLLPPAGPWDNQAVQIRLQSAAITLRRLPAGQERRWLDSLRALWPDVPTQWEEYGSVAVSARPPAPSPHAITLMEEVLGWYVAFFNPEHIPPDLPPDIGAVIWARSSNLSWSKIVAWRSVKPRALRRGNSPTMLKWYERCCLTWISDVLNKSRVELRMP